MIITQAFDLGGTVRHARMWVFGLPTPVCGPGVRAPVYSFWGSLLDNKRIASQ